MTERLLNVKEVAERLGLSQRVIWSYRDMGVIPAPIKLRGAVRWREKSIENWIVDGCPDCRKMKGGQDGR